MLIELLVIIALLIGVLLPAPGYGSPEFSANDVYLQNPRTGDHLQLNGRRANYGWINKHSM